MLRLSHFAATGLLLLGLSTNLSAEELDMPPVPESEAETPVTEATAPGATEYSVQLPGRGMTMETVQNRFGQALETYPAVGEPPISKWVYKDFTVYFESEFVIHAVVNQ
ncbi:MAG: hypothetical protein OEY78_11695 [Gammaproteobacteria bacterium]|nr:hypothetical protein [Gammaproteobacteria bacterium]